MNYSNILETIGNTPIVKLENLLPNKKINIFAKLEGQNPGGSIKDRIALNMIEAAEISGELTKDKTILEPTSGNTGIGLALVGAIKGYKVIITMAANMSDERKKIIRSFGAKLIETDPEKSTDGAIVEAEKIKQSEPSKYWMPNQFQNINNPMTHYKYTANEIIKQVPNISMLVAGMGTSGTLMGLGKKLKEYNPKIKIVGVEPEQKHKISGLKNMTESLVPAIYMESKLDSKIIVKTERAKQMTRKLAIQYGLFVGISSGAALVGALKIARKQKAENIVVIFPDRGEKYLSGDLFK